MNNKPAYLRKNKILLKNVNHNAKGINIFNINICSLQQKSAFLFNDLIKL